MIHFYYFSSLKKKTISLYKSFQPFLLFYLFLIIALTFFFSCTPSERFTKKEETISFDSELRVLLNEYNEKEFLNVESPAYLNDYSSRLALIKPGSSIQIFNKDDNLGLTVNGKDYLGKKFFLSPANSAEIIKLNGKKYRGKIVISSSEYNISIINLVFLEDYVKGVLAKEMPLGKNNENFESLKALAICIRTYAIIKMSDGKINFDLYSDTRDQVYGGFDAENPMSNKAVDETKNLVVEYGGKPALLYYHSTCGGYTESSTNVFSNEPIPYLISIKDGDEPYCKISPRFKWQEIYEKEKIVDRLRNYSLLDDANYELEDISVISNFESGRVAELEVNLFGHNEEKKLIILKGNEIRSILRTSDNKSILWSTLFDLSINSNSVVLNGYGFGHGVGLCQWGAIALSQKGSSYEEILQHYYPGTTIGYFK